MDNETVKNTEQETQKQYALESAQLGQQRQLESAAGKGGQAVLKKKPPISLIAAAAVVLVALLVGIDIYNTPANRLSR